MTGTKTNMHIMKMKSNIIEDASRDTIYIYIYNALLI